MVAPAPVVPRAVASLRVVHQHRLGSCRGLLVVTRDGVEYQPDAAEHQVKDGFALPYTRFLSEMSGGSLVIKSNDRDYRFKPDVRRQRPRPYRAARRRHRAAALRGHAPPPGARQSWRSALSG